MGALTEGTDFFIIPDANNSLRQVLVQTIETVDAGDTLTVDLSKYGIADSGFIGVLGFKHTTANSVSVQEQPTTAVTSGVLTLTVPAGTDDDPRYYIIYGWASTNPAA